MKLKEAASALGKKFGAGASVSKSAEGKPEIDVQVSGVLLMRDRGCDVRRRYGTFVFLLIITVRTIHSSPNRFCTRAG